MKRQTVTDIVGLALLGLFLLSVVGCGGGAITSLSKEEFQKKVVGMSPEEVVKWLGKPTSVTNDTGYYANWHYRNACFDKLTAKKFDADIKVQYKQPDMFTGNMIKVISCNFSSD